MLLSTYAEPHALKLAQDKFSRAALVDNEGVDAFAARLRSLAELCGNIHYEGMMKQQLIQDLPEYLRTDAVVYNSAQRNYQQLSTYVTGKYRAAKDVMALANRGSPEELSRKRQTSTRPRGLPVNQLHSSWDKDDTATKRHGRGAAVGYPGVPHGWCIALPSTGGPDGSPAVLHVLDAWPPSP